jgi:VWFA-related protein
MRVNFTTFGPSKALAVVRIGSVLPAVFAFLLLNIAFAVSQSQERQPVEIIKIDSNLVSVPVIVSDRENHYLAGLKVEDFKLYDNSSEQKIAFFDAADEPLNVALLLDTSRSTAGVLKKIKGAAKDFLMELRPQDRAMIVSFDINIHQLSPLTSDRRVLEKAIKNAEVEGYFGTKLNDAVSEVIEKALRPITGRKAIILLTDGEDIGSQTSSSDLLDSAAESDTMIYSIYYDSSPDRGFRDGKRRGPGGGPGPWAGKGAGIFDRGGQQPFDVFGSMQDQLPQERPSEPGQRAGFPDADSVRDLLRARREERRQYAMAFLTKLSDETSGRFYRSEVTDLKQSFDYIAEELRYQYRLGFYPKTADGTLHALKVSVNRPDVAVRSRRQYRTALPK